VLNIGGGFAVPDANHRTRLDLAGLDRQLAAFKAANPGLALWIEPGRYLVATGGVLLARVTQLKQKGDQGYVGVATGMNALIRPALYGAFHEIVNLTRLGADSVGSFDVVGPICETGDVLGHDRLLPLTREGDVLLIANAGAYGRSMASSYNLRHPPEEIVLGA
jgi:diaminopimelate decarboxylase/aspartate kinase